MNWPRPAIVQPAPPPMDAFSSSILSRINAKQKEARADAMKNEKKKRAAARAAAAKAEQERKEKAASEAAKLLAKSATPSRSRAKKRASGSGSAAGPARKRKRRVAEEEPERTQPLPGMEFVARVARPKMSEQSKSSDYSDMFGPEYLIGADVEAVTNLAKGSAEETARCAARSRRRSSATLKRVPWGRNWPK